MLAAARHPAAEHVDEDAPKLLAEQTVDEEVDCGIECQQDVADAVDIADIVVNVDCQQDTLRSVAVEARHASRMSAYNTQYAIIVSSRLQFLTARKGHEAVLPLKV